MLYAVCCRLSRSAAEYPTLFGAVQSVSIASWHFPDSVWLLQSDHPARVVRDAFEGAIEDQDVALVFPLEVGPAVWTPLRNYRFGRQFLQRALQSERQRLDALEGVDSAFETSERG